MPRKNPRPAAKKARQRRKARLARKAKPQPRVIAPELPLTRVALMTVAFQKLAKINKP